MTHYIEIIRYGVYAHLKAEATRGFLGILWWIIEPVLFMSVLYAVFSLGFDDKNFLPG
jgi:lipopolysaccharide transport system permease protein